MYTTQSLFTREEITATEALAAIAIEKLSTSAVSWRDNRRQNATRTVVLIADESGYYHCYAGDALRVARYAALKTYSITFGGKRVDTLTIAPSQITRVLKALKNESLSALFIS